MTSRRKGWNLSILMLAGILPVAIWASGCGGFSSGHPTNPQSRGFSIFPASAVSNPGAHIQFTAQVHGVTGVTGVTWAASSGRITASGLYTVPAGIGKYVITATSVADLTQFASANVTVADNGDPVSSVTVSPTSASSITTGTLPFAATIQGTASDKSVTWTASVGIITSLGQYTAPATPGTGIVTATSNADPTKSAMATIRVNAPGSSPQGASVPAINSLSASPETVQAGQSTLIRWSVTPGATVQLTGLTKVSGQSAEVTPAGTTTYTLTATNAAGSVSQEVTVTVQQHSPLAELTVDASKPGARVPPMFMGFSQEWGTEHKLMGLPGHTNPIYRQLVKNLLNYGAGPIMIRVGGDTTDSSGTPTAETVAPMAQFAADTGAKFTMGVNLASDDVHLAVAQAQNFVANMPTGSLEAIEIGNEPDLYVRDGHRPSSYGPPSFFSNFAEWRSQILPLLPGGVKLMGPSWASSQMLSNLPDFLATEREDVSLISQHNYAGSYCRGKTNPPDFLLQNSASTSGPRSVAAGLALTHQAGLPFRIGEMNSISCGGEPGVSDIFASALWSVDTLFEYFSIGVDGVNFHVAGLNAYAPFGFQVNQTGASTTFSITTIRPEYYGLLLFQQATANHAKLLPLTLSTRANLKAWATIDNIGTVRVVVINKDTSESGVVYVSLSGFGSGVTTRLGARNYQATNGITLGGQTFDGSTDGTLQGTAYGETVVSVGEIYPVAVPPASAALLTIAP